MLSVIAPVSVPIFITLEAYYLINAAKKNTFAIFIYSLILFSFNFLFDLFVLKNIKQYHIIIKM